MTNNITAGTFTLLITALVIPMFLSGDTYATDSSITIEISDPTVDLNVSPSTQGTFAKSGVTNINVSTTNYTGYTLKLSASNGTNPTALVNGNEAIESITSSITEDQFKALDAPTGYNNHWGYLVNKTGESSTTFLPSPTTAGTTLDTTTAANTDANTYALTIGARVDTSMKLGAYSNVFLVEALPNAIPYAIIYYDNLVGNMPTDSTGEATDTTVTISSNVPTRAGYTFQGWCKTTPTTSGGIDTCSHTPIAAGGTLEIDQESTNNFTLYAVWSKNAKNSISNLTYLQDFASLTSAELAQVKNSMTANTSYQLTDSRDNKKYWITKLRTADSNPRNFDGYQIWMTQNLDLDLSTSTTLNSENTDLRQCGSGIYSTGYTTSGGICFWTPGESTKTTMDTTTSTTTPQSYDPGNVYYYQDQSASTTCTTANQCLHWHVGNYYNWSAVIASNNSTSQSADYTYAANSICPAGWRTPTSLTSADGYSDFNYLLVQQGIATNYVGVSTNAVWQTNGYSNIQGSPLYIVRSGYNNGGSLSNAAVYGHLWSGSSVSSAKAYALYYNSGLIYPAHGNGDRYTRLPMRCLVRE